MKPSEDRQDWRRLSSEQRELQRTQGNEDKGFQNCMYGGSVLSENTDNMVCGLDTCCDKPF